jgi:hypothetical protein
MLWALVAVGVAMVLWGMIANDKEDSDRSLWLIIGGIVITVLAFVGRSFVE